MFDPHQITDPETLNNSLDRAGSGRAKIFLYPGDYWYNVQSRLGTYLAYLSANRMDDAYTTFHETMLFARGDPQKRIEIPDDLFDEFERFFNARVVYNPKYGVSRELEEGTHQYIGSVLSLYQLRRILRVKEGEDDQEIGEIIIHGFMDGRHGSQWVESLPPFAWAKMRSDTLDRLSKVRTKIEHIFMAALEEDIDEMYGGDYDPGEEARLEEERREKAREKLRAKGILPPLNDKSYEVEDDEEEEEE